MTVKLRSYSFDDLRDFPEDYELIDGEMVKKNLSSGLHSWICSYILNELLKYDPAENLGLMLQEPSVKLDQVNTPQPDLAFWTQTRQPAINLEVIQVIPDLVIEVWSPHDVDGPKQRRQALDKVRRYQAAGIPLTWVINPVERQVQVFVPGQLAPAQSLSLDDEVEGGEVIPGFKLRVKELFKL